MDRFEQEFSFRRQINTQAIVAFVVGVIVAYVIHRLLGLNVFSPSSLFLTLIVVAVGGLWYHIRRVI